MVVNANFASNLVAGFLFSVWILNSLFPTETSCFWSDFFPILLSFVSLEHGNSTWKKTFIEFGAHFFLPISAYDCFEPFHNLVCNFKAKIFTSLWLRFHFGCTFFGYFSFDFVVESCFPQQPIRIDAFTKFVHRTHTHKSFERQSCAELWDLAFEYFNIFWSNPVGNSNRQRDIVFDMQITYQQMLRSMLNE